MIEESKRLCRDLQHQLPNLHAPSTDSTFSSPTGESVTEKISSKLVAVTGSLAWRAYDFGLLATDLFEHKRVIAGAVIARSLMETTALLYLIHKKTLLAISERDIAPLDDFLVRCMAGNRLTGGEPESPNVLTAIQALDKEPGCDKYAEFYAVLCEFAHPNALGSFYAYSSFDSETRIFNFGHNRGLTNGEDVSFTVVFALEVFLDFQNKIREITPIIVQAAKQIYPE